MRISLLHLVPCCLVYLSRPHYEPCFADRILIFLSRQGIIGEFYPLDHEGDIDFEIRQDEERAQFFQAQGYWPLDFESIREYADMQVEKQTQSVQAQGQHTYASMTEEIAANAKRWMSEEAMVAFKRYIESKDDLKVLHARPEILFIVGT